METTVRVGRNEPCPCGSGKKYKTCCEGKVDVVTETQRAPYRFVGVTVVVLGLAAIVALRFFGDAEPVAEPRAANTVVPTVLPQTAINPVTTGTPAPQPPGPVPLGKVWSAEHGHWHDAPGAASPNAPIPITMSANGTPLPGAVPASPAAFTPQPAGPVPDGKVWSTEHGHWHDAAPAAAPPR